jgi:RHS repeat-associated protein
LTFRSAVCCEVKERYIYGSNRIGTYTQEAEMIGTSASNTTFSHRLGARNYELTNHLGNVLAVVSDAPIKVDTNADHLRDYNLPTLLSSQDYYPFGSIMRERSFGGYRYGFNGQERTDELKGAGNHYTAQFWEYDPRLGKRWNLDPKPNPSISQYATFANNPIWFSDPFGDTTFVTNSGDILNKQMDDDGNLLDNLVYQQTDDGSYKSIGELGGQLDVSEIFTNITGENKSEAYKMGILEWTWSVAPKSELLGTGKWDYKANEATIFGVAWSFDIKSQKSNPSHKFTSFKAGDMTFNNSADFGNFNAGYTGNWTYYGNGISPVLQVYGAGLVETLKDLSHGELMNVMNQSDQMGTGIPPYGDEFDDFLWNTYGMFYSDSEGRPKKKINLNIGGVKPWEPKF